MPMTNRPIPDPNDPIDPDYPPNTLDPASRPYRRPYRTTNTASWIGAFIFALIVIALVGWFASGNHLSRTASNTTTTQNSPITQPAPGTQPPAQPAPTTK